MDKNIKLICFDLDKTLIKGNSWYRLNIALGVTPQEDEELLQEYLAGNITYEKWMGELLDIFKDRGRACKKTIVNVLSKYEYAEGAEDIVRHLRLKGYKLALISGSIDLLVDIVARDLGITMSEANNDFVFDEEGMLDRVVTYGDDAVAKLAHLENFCDKLGIGITECACVGDGDNDIELFKRTRKGVTFTGSKIGSEAWKTIEKLADLERIF